MRCSRTCFCFACSISIIAGCGDEGSPTPSEGSAGEHSDGGPITGGLGSADGGTGGWVSGGPTAGAGITGGATAGGVSTGGSTGVGAATGGSNTGGSAGTGGSDMGGNAGTGGSDMGGSAGTGGSDMGGSAGTGGSDMGGSAGTGGSNLGGADGGAGTVSTAGEGGTGNAGTSTGGAAAAGTDSGGSDSGGTSGAGGMGGSTGTCSPADPGTNPNRICIKGRSYYLNGINVAWGQWTADLTNYDAAQFESLFATLEASGANAIRWWWFIDGEGQLTFQDHLVQPLAQSIFDNLDRAFDAAASHGVLIMPVLLSFDIESQGREFLVTEEAATDAFVTNVVAPLVERYNDHEGLGLWEIMNEGDWLLADEGGTVSTADYQRFHGKVAAGIHEADADALVTTGSAMFKYLEAGNNILSDEVLQAAAGGDPLARLDVYQTHYYGWMHGEGWSYEPWTKTSSEWQGDGKPILIGEFPCKGEAGRWTSMQMHLESVNQGYAGTFCWAYFDNRADDEGAWADAKPGVEAIAAQIPDAMTGE